MARRVIILLVVLAAGAGGYIFYNNYLYKEARNVAAEQPAFTLSADVLLADYEADADAATARYLNKTLSVQGRVTSINDSVAIIDSAVFCALAAKAGVKQDEVVTIKGRCIGYDEIFGEVKLDQCTLNN
jgi:hypothetical protein